MSLVACYTLGGLSVLLSSCTVIHYEAEEEGVAELARIAYVVPSKNATGEATNITGPPQTVPQTRAEVLKLLGPPHKIGRLGDERYAFGYEYRQVVERQIGLSIPKVSFLKLAVGQANAGRQALLVEFSEDDRVLAAGTVSWNENVGFGFNVQMFFAVTPTTETQGLRERWETEAWCTDLLNGPVGMVDLSHDPDAGDSGIRLSGMPKPDVQWPAARTGRR